MSFAVSEQADNRLYCGFENAIEVFDVATPGYDSSDRLKLGLTRREKGGQRGASAASSKTLLTAGIISALAFNPHNPGSFAAGSFAGSVVLYDEDTGERAAAHVEGVEGGGVTQIAFHPLEVNTFFVASRRSDAVQVFDLRDTSAPVGGLARSASSNQRLTFDVDPWGRWLAAGDEVSYYVFIPANSFSTEMRGYGTSQRQRTMLSSSVNSMKVCRPISRKLTPQTPSTACSFIRTSLSSSLVRAHEHICVDRTSSSPATRRATRRATGMRTLRTTRTSRSVLSTSKLARATGVL